MPFVVTCPHCRTQLKSPRPIPSGRTLTCPQCQNGFTLSQPAQEMDLLPVPPPAPASRPVMGRLVTDDDPPRRRRDDDRPENRRPEDDEEDRPRTRRRPVDAVFDDRRRGHVDENEDRPQQRRKNRPMGLVFLLGGLTALFLCCTGGGLTLYLADPFHWFGGSSSDLVVWLPADTQHIERIDFTEVSKHPKALTGVRREITDAEGFGLKAEDVSDAMLGKKSSKGPAEVIVLRLKSAADKDKVVKAAGGTEATANGRRYFKTKGGGAIHFPSDRTVVLTRSEATMTGLLQKDAGKVVISKDLQDCVQRADGHLWAATVGSDATMFGDAGKGGPGLPGMAPMPAAKSAVMTARLSGDEVAIRMEMTFADAETAKRAAEQIDGMFKMIKGFMEMAGGFAKGGNAEVKKMQDMKKVLDSVQITTSGATVIITLTGPIDLVEGFSRGGGFGGF
jgi:hypothetical protein